MRGCLFRLLIGCGLGTVFIPAFLLAGARLLRGKLMATTSDIFLETAGRLVCARLFVKNLVRVISGLNAYG